MVAMVVMVVMVVSSGGVYRLVVDAQATLTAEMQTSSASFRSFSSCDIDVHRRV